MKRKRAYEFHPVGWDVFDARHDIPDGTLVVKTSPPGCPPNGTMGQSYGVICQRCEERFDVNEGGGFTFHLLRCDRYGRERSVEFAQLGDLHADYLA